eukprot:SAG22_NODE_128_length_18787_cov_19.577108_9_plen_123_part_00
MFELFGCPCCMRGEESKYPILVSQTCLFCCCAVLLHSLLLMPWIEALRWGKKSLLRWLLELHSVSTFCNMKSVNGLVRVGHLDRDRCILSCVQRQTHSFRTLLRVSRGRCAVAASILSQAIF